MAFTAYRTWSAATLTAAQMNEQVRDNGNYLKTEVDKLDDCVQQDGTTVAYASPAGTRAKSTVYQNTSGKTRIVNIVVQGAAVDDTLGVYCENANPPTIMVAHWTTSGANPVGTVTFVVPNNYYYKANEDVATITLGEWTEWDLM